MNQVTIGYLETKNRKNITLFDIYSITSIIDLFREATPY